MKKYPSLKIVLVLSLFGSLPAFAQSLPSDVRFIAVPSLSNPNVSAGEIQETEVTQLQWFSVMGNNLSFAKTRELCPQEFTEVKGVSLCPAFPVENVSDCGNNGIWLFISRINAEEATYKYDLVDKALWWTAGARHIGEYPADSATEYGDVRADDEPEPVSISYSVYAKKPNRHGIYGLYGNVSEKLHRTLGLDICNQRAATGGHEYDGNHYATVTATGWGWGNGNASRYRGFRLSRVKK